MVQSPGRGQQWELIVQEGDKGAIEVLGECDIDVRFSPSLPPSTRGKLIPSQQTYPIQKKTLSTEYLRDNAYLRARTGQIAAMLRLRDRVSRSLSQKFEVRSIQPSVVLLNKARSLKDLPTPIHP